MSHNTNIITFLNKYSQVLEVGPYPPPLGGVSVHLSRLSKSLENCEVFDLSQPGGGKFLKLFLSLLFKKRDLVHLHVITLKILVVVFVAQIFRRYPILITDHNSRLFESKSKIQLILLRFFLSRVDNIIVVGEHILNFYTKHKIKPKQNFMISDSFLPPNLTENKKILDTYPLVYHNFVHSHTPIINTNAYKLVLHNGIDLYGIDLCVELIYRLKNKYPNIGLLVFLADEDYNAKYLCKLKELVIHRDLENNIIFITNQRELWPSYQDSDLMVRATVTDGFGISVAEAMYVGCPAIASDVCKRAPGATIFRNRDIDDLYQKSLEILKSSRRKVCPRIDVDL